MRSVTEARSASTVQRIRLRLENDFGLAIISLFGLFSVTSIFPFGLYRLATGAYSIALVDFAIVAGIGLTVWRAWRHGDVRAAGIIMAVVNTAACLMVVYLFGRHGLMWVYVVEVTNFFLASRRIAVASSGLLMVATLAQGSLFTSGLEQLTFLATNVLVATCAFIFAWRTERQRQRLEALVLLDPLTGVGNRRAMADKLARCLAAAQRQPIQNALAMVDIDHFKAINDHHGHEVGDQALIGFTKLVSRLARQNDRLYRYGGEEFVVLLPATDLDGARILMDRLRQALREDPDLQDLRMTVSIGLAEMPLAGGWSSWLAAADHALYQAKKSGRDRIEVANSAISGAAAAR